MRIALLAPVYFFRGLLHVVYHRELWKYVALSFLINALIFTAAVVALILFYGDLTGLAPDCFGVAGEIALGILIAFVAVILVLFLYTFVGNAVAGPFLDLMTERMLIGLGDPPPPARSTLRMIFEPLWRQAQKLFVFVFLQGAALLLWLVPILGPVLYPVAAGLLLFYFLGLEYIDYPLDVRGVSVWGRVRFSFEHLGGTVAFGAVVALVSFVPLLGYACLPVAVAGATLLVHETDSSARLSRPDA